MTTVRMIETNEILTFDDSYAMRLIEQGTAVLVSRDDPGGGVIYAKTGDKRLIDVMMQMMNPLACYDGAANGSLTIAGLTFVRENETTRITGTAATDVMVLLNAANEIIASDSVTPYEMPEGWNDLTIGSALRRGPTVAWSQRGYIIPHGVNIGLLDGNMDAWAAILDNPLAEDGAFATGNGYFAGGGNEGTALVLQVEAGTYIPDGYAIVVQVVGGVDQT